MAYTLYRNVKVLSIKREEVSRQTRPQEIADPARRRSNYFVSTASFTDVPFDATIGDFKGEIQQGQTVSVAIDDKWQVIAVVNHTTGHQAALKYKTMEFSDIFGILFFMAIPGILCYSLASKAFQTEKYHDYGWGILALGAIILLLVLRGVTKQFTESKSALNKLLSR